MPPKEAYFQSGQDKATSLGTIMTQLVNLTTDLVGCTVKTKSQCTISLQVSAPNYNLESLEEYCLALPINIEEINKTDKHARN